MTDFTITLDIFMWLWGNDFLPLSEFLPISHMLSVLCNCSCHNKRCLELYLVYLLRHSRPSFCFSSKTTSRLICTELFSGLYNLYAFILGSFPRLITALLRSLNFVVCTCGSFMYAKQPNTRICAMFWFVSRPSLEWGHS